MKFRRLHRWDYSPKEAIALQKQLADQVDQRSPLRRFSLVAGADVSYNRFSDVVHAGVVVLNAADLSVIEEQAVTMRVRFPYVPGLLSFRESPPVLEAFARLRHRPDVVLIDGQGLAHPRRFGIACHIGLWLNLPTVGCAKSILVGEYKRLGSRRGAVAPLVDRGETVGMAVRTRTGVKPVFVSVGHRIDLAGAVRAVLATCDRYRLPEPTRRAHHLVNAVRQQSGPA